MTPTITVTTADAVSHLEIFTHKTHISELSSTDEKKKLLYSLHIGWFLTCTFFREIRGTVCPKNKIGPDANAPFHLHATFTSGLFNVRVCLLSVRPLSV